MTVAGDVGSGPTGPTGTGSEPMQRYGQTDVRRRKKPYKIKKFSEFVVDSDDRNDNNLKEELKAMYLKNIFEEVQHSTSKLYEKVIPMNIILKKIDLSYLQNEFPDIIFSEIANPKDLNGYIDDKGIIHIAYSLGNSITELEAIIGHEMIHMEQRKKSNDKWLEQSANTVKLINNKIKNIGSSEDEKEIQVLIQKFNFLSPEEKMAYAYQLVKLMGGDMTKIMKHIKNDTLYSIYSNDKRFLKYVYMYSNIWKSI